MLISFVLNLGAELVGKKWRAVVIWHLKDGPLRFSQIKKLMPDVSVKVLSEVLKEMETNSLLVRVQYPTIPVKVTYEIHPDATDFVEANAVCVIKIAEYIIKNHIQHGVTEELIIELKEWVATNKLPKEQFTN
jgi:DNA-binding HxlR family transcriptional regulator